jgi:hypothetical protein
LLAELFRSLWQWLWALPRRIKRWFTGAPGRFLHWWREHPQERWGYFWWGTAGAVVAVPELWAAVGGDNVPWPTISGLIGNLEVSHQWVAFIVIGVLVWGAFHAIAVTRLPPHRDLDAFSNPDRERRRVIGGRLTTAEQTERLHHPFRYIVIAVALVAIPSWLTHHFATGDDRRYVFGEVMYASIGFWWMIVPGWLAYKRGKLVPFPTLFTTFKDLERRFRLFAVVVAAGLAILMIHLTLYPWPATIPDVSRLRATYDCHPLNPPKEPPSAKKQQQCRKLDEADIKPSAYAP